MFSPEKILPHQKDLINLNNIHLNIMNSCGYCSSTPRGNKFPKTWVTTGFSCPLMSCDTYQMLLEKGWRRCGTYYYKPDVSKCCCRPYTIRLEVEKYRIRSSHLHSLKKFRNFLHLSDQSELNSMDSLELETEVKSLVYEIFERIRDDFKINGCCLPLLKSEDISKIKFMNPKIKKRKFIRTCNLLWLLYKLNESFMRSVDIDLKHFRKELTKFIDEFMKQQTDCGFKIKCHNSGYISIKLKEKIKHKINVQEYIESTLASNSLSEFEIKLVPAEYEEESYEVYKKYSSAIHNISESRTSYKNFLCQQALETTGIHYNTSDFSGYFASSESIVPTKYGCFHMKYYFQKKLIAVGVVDILPKGLSSVYFFYDPDYKKYSLGVIGSLREINVVTRISTILPKFKYYYMGYYIQSSKKMKYKGFFEPSELLCPKTMNWVELNEKTKDIIDVHNEDPVIYRENEQTIIKNRIKMPDNEIKKEFLLKKKLFFIGEWISMDELQMKYMNNFLEIMINFGKIIGKEALEKIEFSLA